jgi:hypothetical protein
MDLHKTKTFQPNKIKAEYKTDKKIFKIYYVLEIRKENVETRF